MSDGAAQDLLTALRSLTRRPRFPLVVVTTLALGIGTNAGVFAVIRGVILAPLPYRDADRIGVLWHRFGAGGQNLPAVNPLDVRDYRERSETIEDFTIARGFEQVLGGIENPELVDVGAVEAGFFEFFGVEPFLGRTVRPEEDRPGAAPVAVLSHRLWVRSFGADPEAVGRLIDLDGIATQIIGVAPPRFHLHLPPEALFLRDAEVWTSLRLDFSSLGARNVTLYTAFGRLRPRATFVEARRELGYLSDGLRAEHPEHAEAELRASIVALRADVVKRARPRLMLLFGAVALLLVVACINVTHLGLVRGHSRQLEHSVRVALGAGPESIVRLELFESLILSVTGAVAGVALAALGVTGVKRWAQGSIPRLDEVGMDGTVFLFTAGIALLSTLAWGLAPALRAASADPARPLRGGGRTTTGRRGRRLGRLLVVAEVSASVVLLVGTGLLGQSLRALGESDPGYATTGVLTFRVGLPPGSASGPEARSVLRDRMLERVAALPGASGAAAVTQLPLTGVGSAQPFAYDENTATNWESVTADRRLVTPDFFDVMGVHLLAGRALTQADASVGSVVVIDDGLARLAFGNRDPVGQRLQVRPNGTPDQQRYAEVVGVVAHLRLHDLSRAHLPQLYWPMSGLARFSVVVRTSGDPQALVPGVQEILGELAPGAPVEDIRPMAALVSDALAPTRLLAGLMTGFGSIALLLAAVGIYGVLGQWVAQRTREIGVRIALGQSPGAARRFVVAEAGRLVALGVLLGGLAASVFARAAEGLLFGVRPVEPPAYLAAAVLILLVGGAATWVPAARAAEVDPLVALKSM